jgi:16S rRNA (uracil1498-N3)-methyltransferase
MKLFYEPDIKKVQFLSEVDSKHCIKVLRLSVGEFIHVVDGRGGLFLCKIQKADPKKCEVKIIEEQSEYGKTDFYFHLAIAPTKNAERLEWMIEKCVEIGIHEISLIQTKHSERKNQKIERLNKIAISAMKQSLKAYLPIINDLISFEKFIQTNKNTQKFIAHLDEKAQPLQQIMQPQGNYCVLIGPEGDFSKEEIDIAQTADYQVVTLGNSRLRTETAGLVATTLINSIN